MSDHAAKYDAVIIGAGPAGSSCAIRLAKNGLKVLLAEQKKFPRPKLCGEFISPECLAHFSELGVLEKMSSGGGVPITRTVFYARSGRSVTVPSEWLSSGSLALGLSRAQMDHILLLQAAAFGVEVLEETTATGLLRDDGEKVCGVVMRSRSGRSFSVNAELVIDATGRSRILARFADPTAKKRRADFVAFKTHLSGAATPATDCEIYSYRDGYGGSSLVENGLTNLCFIIKAAIARQYGSDAEQVLRNVVFTNRQAKRSLGEAKIVDPWLAVPIENYGPADLSPARGLLSIGDAAGFIDPFTGSGILLSLESSRIAAAVIAAFGASDFHALIDEYRRRYTLAFDRRLKVSSLVRRSAFIPLFADTVINCLSLSDRLTHYLAKATRLSPDPTGADL
jgi:flavin-dependent dehydrogenase